MGDKYLDKPEEEKTPDEIKYEAAVKKQKKLTKDEERKKKFSNKNKKLKRDSCEIISIDFKRGSITSIIPSKTGDNNE